MSVKSRKVQIKHLSIQTRNKLLNKMQEEIVMLYFLLIMTVRNSNLATQSMKFIINKSSIITMLITNEEGLSLRPKCLSTSYVFILKQQNVAGVSVCLTVSASACPSHADIVPTGRKLGLKDIYFSLSQVSCCSKLWGSSILYEKWYTTMMWWVICIEKLASKLPVLFSR